MTKNLKMKNSQFKTTADSENEKWLIFDLESDGLYNDVTKVYCLSVYDIQKEKLITFEPDFIQEGINYLLDAKRVLLRLVLLPTGLLMFFFASLF